MLKCCYAIFWMYGSKNILFMFPLFKKRKSHEFSNFSRPGSRKVLTSAKIISGQKCRRLMQDNLKYLCVQFGYDWTKNKEWWRRINLTYLTSKMPNSCRIKKKEQIKKNKCIKKKWSKKIGYIEKKQILLWLCVIGRILSSGSQQRRI